MAQALSRLLEDSDLLHDRTSVVSAIGRMATEIATAHAGRELLMLTVMNGGMPFAGLLALEMGVVREGVEPVDLILDYVHATRYRGATRGADLHWLKRPEAPMAGRDVLLVDDILDEGHTLAAIRDWCLEQGAASVRIAALTVKQHDRCVPGLVADYTGFVVPDRYVFGFGMDAGERARHLPEIRAMRDGADGKGAA